MLFPGSELNLADAWTLLNEDDTPIDDAVISYNAYSVAFTSNSDSFSDRLRLYNSVGQRKFKFVLNEGYTSDAPQEEFMITIKFMDACFEAEIIMEPRN